MKLKDSLGGTVLNLRMDDVSSAVLSNESVSSLLIIMWHPRPLGIKVEDKEIPKEFVLYSNYPNPFNPSTNIKFSVMQPTTTRLVVYNVLGEKIRDLVNNFFNPGTYSVQWNGLNDDSHSVPSGVYFVKMTTDAPGNQTNQTFYATQKMLLMK
jgi:hypothetical protein